MSERLALTLFVKANDEACDSAREEVQAVLTGLAEDATIEVLDVVKAGSAAKGVDTTPMLRIQVGSSAPEWMVQVERRSLARRLLDMGVEFRPRPN